MLRLERLEPSIFHQKHSLPRPSFLRCCSRLFLLLKIIRFRERIFFWNSGNISPSSFHHKTLLKSSRLYESFQHRLRPHIRPVPRIAPVPAEKAPKHRDTSFFIFAPDKLRHPHRLSTLKPGNT